MAAFVVASGAGAASSPVMVEPVDEVFFDQVGLGIDGHSSVPSADGTRVAVDGDAVRVFEWDGVRWSQLGAEFEGGRLGALSADGRRLVLSLKADGADVDRTRVLEWDGSGWSQVGADLDGLGGMTSSDGNRLTLRVRARDDCGAFWSSYSSYIVRIVEWDGFRWAELGDGLGNGTCEGSVSELAMSPDGDRVALSLEVGLAGVRVVEWDGSGWTQVGADIVWDELAKIVEDLTGRSLDVGYSNRVALSADGGRVAIRNHAQWSDVGDYEAGRLIVLDDVGGTWVTADEQELNVDGDVALSADGRRLAYHEAPGFLTMNDRPRDVVVRDDGPGGWATVGAIRLDDPSSVAMSADGSRIAVWSDEIHVFELSSMPPPPLASPVALMPARLLDTRAGESTVDGISAGIGRRPAESVVEVPVVDRGGVPDEAVAVMLNVTAVGPDAAGHLTVYPCDEPLPETSVLNYTAGHVIANSVFIGLATDGSVCVYTHAATDMVVDVTGYTPTRAGLRPMAPERFMDTRSGVIAVGWDEGPRFEWEHVDRVAAGSAIELWVAGRDGVPWDATAVIVNVTAVDPDAAGHLTVYPCDTTRPLASNLNYTAGQVIANSALTDIGSRGTVCIYTHATTDIVADVTGYLPADEGLWSLVPARLLDTRAGEATVDGVSAGIGRRPAESVTVVPVTGRGGVDDDAAAVVLDVVAVQPDGAGHLTVYPCEAPRPLASNLNYAAGQVIANSVFTALGANGTVCIYTHAATDLVVDVTGHT